jgi:hypothetical protein
MLFLYDMFVHVEWGHFCIFLPLHGHPHVAMGPSLNLWDPELDVALKFPLASNIVYLIDYIYIYIRCNTSFYCHDHIHFVVH